MDHFHSVCYPFFDHKVLPTPNSDRWGLSAWRKEQAARDVLLRDVMEERARQLTLKRVPCRLGPIFFPYLYKNREIAFKPACVFIFVLATGHGMVLLIVETKIKFISSRTQATSQCFTRSHFSIFILNQTSSKISRPQWTQVQRPIRSNEDNLVHSIAKFSLCCPPFFCATSKYGMKNPVFVNLCFDLLNS